MVLFLTYFMLLSDQLFKRKLVEIVGTLSQKKVTVTRARRHRRPDRAIPDDSAADERGRGGGDWGALWAMGLQQAALWGLLAGIFNSIPYYGPLLVTAGLSLVGFLQFGTSA